jgi:YceI-like domain
LSGTLSIRGTPGPFTVTLRITSDSKSGASFRAIGDAEVNLSTYGIDRPSQLGVQTADAVTLRFELVGRASTQVTTTARHTGDW